MPASGQRGTIVNDAAEKNKIYPCDFPIKIIGKNEINLERIVLEVLSSFVENIQEAEIKKTTSRGKKYQSITIHIIIKDRAHMDAIYCALAAREEIIMVL